MNTRKWSGKSNNFKILPKRHFEEIQPDSKLPNLSKERIHEYVKFMFCAKGSF